MPDRDSNPSAYHSDALSAQIERARDTVDLAKWSPVRQGIIPEIRLGTRWFNTLWLVPIGFVVLVLGIAFAHELREFPEVQNFIARYPGNLSGPVDYHGFPLWIRIEHAFNLFLMMFIIRSGIQILADHPRLYWDNNCTPGREWFRFQRAVPEGVVWTAKDDAVTVPGWLGIPGIRHSIGLARWWHFTCDLLWLLNGLIFYLCLFSGTQWQRMVPTSWDVFPNAVSVGLQYLSLTMPHEMGWVRYNCLQQIAYFITVFVAAPIAVFTGLMQAPAISNKLGVVGKVFNRQVARSIHFMVLLWFLQFIVVHVTMVLITGARRNLNHITIGTDTTVITGTAIATLALLVLFACWALASPLTLTHARIVQKIGRFMLGPVLNFLEGIDPKTQYSESDIAPHLWPNGLVPSADDFKELHAGQFVDYKLQVDGHVEAPRQFTYDELKAMPKQEQITNHFCIQGWSGVAKWSGVPMRYLMEQVKPTADAKYVVFYSFGEGAEGGIYYDAHKIENMRHELTILAYEMNGKPLPLLHGAPLRLRCENELGFKQVKWIRAIEFVKDFKHIGSGQGGYNEDHEFYGYRDPI